MILYWTMKLLAMYGAGAIAQGVLNVGGTRSRGVRFAVMAVFVFATAMLFDVALTPTYKVAFVKVSP